MTKYLITSALPYINGIKHLGNLAGSILPADVNARFLRQQGEEVLFICGTDEHGTPAELAAQSHQQSVADYCEAMYRTQKNIYQQFAISFDYFGRSSSQDNYLTTQAIFKALDHQDCIQEKQSKQMYSNTDQRFLPDRYIIGECPHCHYEQARGDQCDGCGKLLEPTELISPTSAISQSTDIVIKTSKHLYLDLKKLSTLCESWLEKTSQAWPTVSRGIARKWLQEGLHARCITRDLSWGVPIPKPSYEHKVFYVWFDAPMAYISMTKTWATSQGQPDAWRAWWQPDHPEDVNYCQFMAKDNVAFHAIFWPAMLLGSQQPWKMVDTIKAVNWLTYEGGKFSTSQQRGIFTDTALALFPADYWRYYLLSIMPESSDSDFNVAHFAQTINKDLADTLGNFIGRVTALIERHCDGNAPSCKHHALPDDLATKAQALLSQIDTLQRTYKYRQTIQALKALWMLGNEYIAEQQPWSTIKASPDEAKAVLYHCLILIRCYAIASAAIIPHTAQHIFTLLNLNQDPGTIAFTDAFDCSALQPGHPISRASGLFKKISPEEITTLSERFAGDKES